MTTIQLHGWDGKSDLGTADTRPVTIETGDNHVMLHLQRDGEEPGQCAAAWVQWLPAQGWQVTIHDRNDESSTTILIPDDGSSVVVDRPLISKKPEIVRQKR